MQNLLKLSMIGFALVLGTSTFAVAAPHTLGKGHTPPKSTPQPVTPPRTGVAPEVDPSLALSGLTLLAGALTVVRTRRRKQ